MTQYATIEELVADLDNLLTNGNFEAGTWRETHTGQEFGEISVPVEWTAYWLEGDMMRRPEMKVIDAVPPFLDPPRVYEGTQAVQWFTFYGNHQAGLLQAVPNLTPGARYRLSAHVHAWYSQRDDSHKSEYKDSGGTWHEIKNGDRGMVFYLWVDVEGRSDPWVVVSGSHEATGNIYNEYAELSLEFEAVGTSATVFIESTTLYPFKHCDAYVDAMMLEKIADPPTPPDCPGKPREDYARVYHVMPKETTLERFAEVRATYPHDTIGMSYDDAGIGDLSNKTAYLWDLPADVRGEYRDFFTKYYPLTKVVFMPPDDIDPPDPGEPVPFDIPENVIGLHSQFPRARSRYYLERGRPAAQKHFSAGDAWRAKQWSPGTMTIWRKFVGDPGLSDDLLAQARWLVDQYTAEIATAATALGITVENLLSGIDIAESLNETIPSFNPDLIQRAVQFDVLFAEELHARYDDLLRPGLLTVPIGNPHESEVHYLIPAARAAMNYGGVVCYHGYWTRNERAGYIADYWKWHAGRWMEWDNVFRAAGVYPRYVATEGGIVYSPGDGTDFSSGQGWKSCGPFDRYIEDLWEYTRRVKVWNALHANRCAGVTLFGYGAWGWDNFELGDGEVEWLAMEFGPADIDISAFPFGLLPSLVGDTREKRRATLDHYLATANYITPEYRAFLSDKLR